MRLWSPRFNPHTHDKPELSRALENKKSAEIFLKCRYDLWMEPVAATLPRNEARTGQGTCEWHLLGLRPEWPVLAGRLLHLPGQPPPFQCPQVTLNRGETCRPEKHQPLMAQGGGWVTDPDCGAGGRHATAPVSQGQGPRDKSVCTADFTSGNGVTRLPRVKGPKS